MDPLKSKIEELILDPAQRAATPHAGQIGYVRAFAQPESIDTENRRIRFVCSTRNIDRYGEIVEPEAFRASLDTFRANPVFMAGHVYVAPSGKPTSIGHWPEIGITSDGLEGVAEFMADDELAEDYWKRYSRGVQKAVSVGFIVHAWRMEDREVEGQRQRVRVFTDVELIEVSAVAIPANRQSLVRAAGLYAGGMRAAAAAGGAGALEGGEELSKAIEPAIERVLERRLDASPGGYLSVLVQDVVESTLSRSKGYSVDDDPYDHVAEDGTAPGDPSASEGDGELKQMLRGMVGATDGDAADTGGDE